MLRNLIIIALIVASFTVIGQFSQNWLKTGYLEKIFNVFSTGMKNTSANSQNHVKKGSKESQEGTQSILTDSIAEYYDLGQQHIKSANSANYYILYLPKGKPLEEYASEIYGIAQRLKFTVVRGVWGKSSSPSFTLIFKKNDSAIKINFQYSNGYLKASAKLSIVFTDMEACTQEDLIMLSAMSWEKTYVIDPYTSNENLLKFIRMQDRDEVLLQLPMEPLEYPYLNPGKGAIFIHHSQNQINFLLREKLKYIPAARGFCSLYGGRAIEHRLLLKRLFTYLSEENLIFLDVTSSQRSQSTVASREFNTWSRRATKNKNTNSYLSHIDKKMVSARKYGEAILVFPYSKKAIIELNQFILKNSIQYQGYELSTLSKLSHH